MNGKNKEFNFVPEDTAADVAQYVFDNWPAGKQHHYMHICMTIRAFT